MLELLRYSESTINLLTPLALLPHVPTCRDPRNGSGIPMNRDLSGGKCLSALAPLVRGTLKISRRLKLSVPRPRLVNVSLFLVFTIDTTPPDDIGGISALCNSDKWHMSPRPDESGFKTGAKDGRGDPAPTIGHCGVIGTKVMAYGACLLLFGEFYNYLYTFDTQPTP